MAKPEIEETAEAPRPPSRADEFVLFTGRVLLVVFVALALAHWPLWLMIPAIPGALWLAAKRDRRAR